MKKRLTLALLSLMLLAAPALHAQYSLGSYPCGPANTKLVSCNGFPVYLDGVLEGTAWLNAQLSPTSTGPSFIIWGAGMEMTPQANIGKVICDTKETFTSGLHTAPDECTVLTVYFSGGDLADQTYYTGFATFHFDYTYAGYGTSAGWKRKLVAGALKIVNY